VFLQFHKMSVAKEAAFEGKLLIGRSGVPAGNVSSSPLRVAGVERRSALGLQFDDYLHGKQRVDGPNECFGRLST
jgi:hypothetical protein